MLSNGLINTFARHKVAANLLMALMLFSGFWALSRINIQFLPTFSIKEVTINIVWPGASAEDIENSITNPIERELRSLDDVKEMRSTSRTSSALITVEFNQNTDMGRAVEDVRERVNRVRNLPQDAEKPIITKVVPYETVAKLIITGPQDLAAIRPMVHRFERELLDAGIAKVDLVGLPDQEIAIQINTQQLAELKLSLPQIADLIKKRSEDLPAGTIGKENVGRQLRSLQQGRSVKDFENLPIINDARGQLVRIADIATVTQRSQDEEVLVYYQGKPGVEMRLQRAEDANSLHSAQILHDWLIKTRQEVGDSLQIHVYDQRWILIKERINLLLKNGLGGLLLILGILFLLLNRQVALWVSVGIPTSFMAALAILYLYGGSIDMVSLFAFIMTLGIIVDDTIVIGEQALTNIHAGIPRQQAIESGAHKMLPPIMSSTLTTVSAFLPLLMIGGVIGTILFAIPLIVICVLIASVIECFLVLPGHLAHSFRRKPVEDASGIRQTINQRFADFRDHQFKRLVKLALHYRGITLASSFAVFLLTLGLLIGGHINFTFFPTPEGRILKANVQFIVGTPQSEVKKFLNHIEQQLYQTEKELEQQYNKHMVTISTTTLNRAELNNYQRNNGEQFASMFVELVSPDQRPINNNQFIQLWQDKIILPPSVENFSIFSPRGGPPGEDIDIELSGASSTVLKSAAIELKNSLRNINGVSDINDDLPFGQEQKVFALNPTGKSIGLTINDVGTQLRAAFNGEIVQIFHEPNEEIEVRVMLPDNERNNIHTLEYYPIITNGKDTVPLGTVVNLSSHRSPDTLLHTDTKLTVHIRAKVDNTVNNANRILQQLQQGQLLEITNKYNLQLSLKGKAEEQSETLTDMKYGLVLGLILIYIILAWVFTSYGWPLVVMSVIPLGLCGAVFGHLIMGIDLTLLSLFGIFGLSGIVINDSIILLTEYKHLREKNMPVRPAIIEASRLRFRAVLLTSLTTIAGLTPLLFERSLQAQFLIPMATSITFGLAFATIMILVVIPTLLSLYEDWQKK